jgi:hypothetical protein
MSMNNGHTWFLLGLAFPVLMLFVHVFKRALPPGIGKPWAWLSAAFVSVLVGEMTGLLAATGIDSRSAMKSVLLLGVILVLIQDFINRVCRWP